MFPGALRGKYIIYGAHLVAVECCRYLKSIGKGPDFMGFAVTDAADNPIELDGYPVRVIQSYEAEAQKGSPTVLLAMPGKFHAEVQATARRYGFDRFIPVTLEALSEVKADWILSMWRKRGESDFRLEKSKNDPTWLDLTAHSGKNEIRCKFPTLFYEPLDDVLSTLTSEQFEAMPEIVRVPDGHDSIVGSSGNDTPDDFCIYMAYSEADLKSWEGRSIPAWVSPLQVGCAAARARNGPNFDDKGDNISSKNRLFAEMTGAYWIWKNAPKTKYKGLCHYRRFFDLSAPQISALKQDGIDALLTTPRYVPYGVGNMFLAETPVKQPVLDAMLQAVGELWPQEKELLLNFLNQCFYFPNNMMVAKSELYDAYCSWTFSVLFRMEELLDKIDYGHKMDRHIAYAAELLTSYYFAKRIGELCILSCDYRYFA